MADDTSITSPFYEYSLASAFSFRSTPLWSKRMSLFESKGTSAFSFLLSNLFLALLTTLIYFTFFNDLLAEVIDLISFHHYTFFWWRFRFFLVSFFSCVLSWTFYIFIDKHDEINFMIQDWFLSWRYLLFCWPKIYIFCFCFTAIYSCGD